MPPVPSKSGKELNRIWEVNASHALYRADGTWYHLLKTFPGALFDDYGYVLFQNEEELYSCEYLNVKQHIHVLNGISSIPTYVLKQDSGTAADVEEPSPTRRSSCTVNRIIRDTAQAQRVKAMYDHTCQMCGTRLMLTDAVAYAEAHHIKPLGLKHGGPDSKENLICVCPNCHALLDFGAIPIDLDSLSFKGGHSIKADFVEYHNEFIFKGKTV